MSELVNLSWPLIRDFATDLFRTPNAIAQRRHFLKQDKCAIGYIGWVGHNNLGDEVMFDVICKAISPFPILKLFPEPGERLMGRLGLGGPTLFRAVLIGGGTLINPLYLPVVQLFKARRLPIYTVGTGVGNPGFGISHDDRDSLQEWADILCEMPFLSVRGPLSQQLLYRAGVTHAEIIGDPALMLTPDDAPAFRSKWRLILNLSHESSRPPKMAGSQFFQVAANVAKEFAAKGGEVLGVALGEGDRQALQAFRHQTGIAMRIEDHRHSGEKFLKAISGSYALLSVRLHAAVLASCVGVPALLLAYRSKCRDFMSSMGMEQFAVPLAEGTNAAMLENLFQQLMSNSLLGSELYGRALFWKRKQNEYYKRLLTDLII